MNRWRIWSGIVFCFAASHSSVAFAEIKKNTHLFAMVQVNQICKGETEVSGSYVRIAIYRSNNGNLYTYLMNTAGAEFGPTGGRKSSKLDDMDIVSELRFSGRDIYLNEQGTQSSGKRTAIVSFNVEMTSDGSMCSVNSCKSDVVLKGERRPCKVKCWPEACEVRSGPAS